MKPLWVHNRIKKLYQKDRYSIRMIRKDLEEKGVTMSQQGVWMSLKRQGVETKREIVAKSKMGCRACGREVMVERNKIRRHNAHFCDEICKRAHVEVFGNPGRVPTMKSRKSMNQRLAVSALRYIYSHLPEKFVVHFIDDDFKNHRSYNLLAFENQHEHIRYHRGDPTARQISLKG